MLYSFDIDGTILNHKEGAPLQDCLDSRAIYAIVQSLIEGDVILINTGRCTIDILQQICGEIFSFVYLVNADGENYFSNQERWRFFEAFNSNFYISNFCGACLRQAKPRLKKEILREAYSNNRTYVRFSEPLYEHKISEKTIDKLNILIHNHAYFENIGKNYSARTANKQQERRVIDLALEPATYLFYRQQSPIKRDNISRENQIRKLLKSKSLPLNINCYGDKGVAFVSNKATKATPIAYLKQKYNFNTNEVAHFGNETNDIIPQNLGHSYIIKNDYFIKQQEVEKHKLDNVTFINDVPSKLAEIKLDKMLQK